MFLTVTTGMKNNIFDSRQQSIYSTNNSTLPLMIQLQSEPRSRIMLIKIVNPTFSVYIIVLCPENASNDNVTGLNWIPGTDKMDAYRTLARFPVFEWVLYQEHTFTDKRQNTRNRRQNRFLPLKKMPSILLSVFHHHVSILFSCTLLLFYFFVWYSHIESARFVIVYHSCVPIHKTKRSMSRLTNPITPTDFFITEIRLSYFHNFFIFFFGSIKINCVSNDSQHISFPLLIRTHWTHTYIYIRMYVS